MFKDLFLKKIGVNLSMRATGVGLGFVTHIVLARWMLSEDYGGYVFLVTSTYLLSMISTLGFRQSIIIYYNKYLLANEISLARGFFLTALVLTSLTCILISSVYYLILNSFFQLGHIALIFAIALTGMAIGRLLEGVLHSSKRFVACYFPDMVFRPVVLLSLVLYYRHFEKLELQTGFVFTLFIMALISADVLWILFSYCFSVMPDSGLPRFSVKEWVTSALPFLGSSGVKILFQRFDVIMLGFLTELSTVAVYSVTCRIFEIVMFITMTFGNIASPYLSEYFHNGRKRVMLEYYTAKSRSLRCLVIPTCFLLMLSSKFILSIFGEEYIRGWPVVVILLSSAIIMSFIGIGQSFLTMSGHQKDLFYMNVCGLVMNICLNLILIPFWGMYGAALATLCSIILICYLVRKKVGRVQHAWRVSFHDV